MTVGKMEYDEEFTLCWFIIWGFFSIRASDLNQFPRFILDFCVLHSIHCCSVSFSVMSSGPTEAMSGSFQIPFAFFQSA